MARTPKVKKREVSFRSRAARRGASPPAKDLAVKAPAKETEYKPWLHNVQNAGISKKQKAKPLKRQQKARQQRAMEKADAVVAKLERKVADSEARSKRIQARAKAWEELNPKALAKQKAAPVAEVTELDPVAEEDGEETKMEDVPLQGADGLLPTSTAPKDAAVETASVTAIDKQVDEVT